MVMFVREKARPFSFPTIHLLQCVPISPSPFHGPCRLSFGLNNSSQDINVGEVKMGNNSERLGYHFGRPGAILKLSRKSVK